MIRMSTKQKIILHRYRDGYSERKIARELTQLDTRFAKIRKNPLFSG